MKTVRLITCNDAVGAHILQGALENEGIESILHNENLSTLLRGYVHDISGVDILVGEADYERAVQVLRDNQSWPGDQKYCPFCHSADIALKLRKGGRVKTFFAVVSSLLAATPPGSNHWIYVCNHCSEKFEIPVSETYKAEATTAEES